MRFHRADVLKRHQEVHVADPQKRRRKPRRGAWPRTSVNETTPRRPSMSSLGEPETGGSVISAISGMSSSPGNIDFGTAGTTTLDADPGQLLRDPSQRAGTIDVEISTPHGTNNWLTHENGNPDLSFFLELDDHQMSHDSGPGMGSGLTQLFTNVQSTEPVNFSPLLGGFCHLSTSEEPAIDQTLDQVRRFFWFRSIN